MGSSRWHFAADREPGGPSVAHRKRSEPRFCVLGSIGDLSQGTKLVRGSTAVAEEFEIGRDLLEQHIGADQGATAAPCGRLGAAAYPAPRTTSPTSAPGSSAPARKGAVAGRHAERRRVDHEPVTGGVVAAEPTGTPGNAAAAARPAPPPPPRGCRKARSSPERPAGDRGGDGGTDPARSDHQAIRAGEIEARRRQREQSRCRRTCRHRASPPAGAGSHCTSPPPRPRR